MTALMPVHPGEADRLVLMQALQGNSVTTVLMLALPGEGGKSVLMQTTQRGSVMTAQMLAHPGGRLRPVLTSILQSAAAMTVLMPAHQEGGEMMALIQARQESQGVLARISQQVILKLQVLVALASHASCQMAAELARSQVQS